MRNRTSQREIPYNLTGQVEDRWGAYNKGLWRRTVSCWIMNEKGEILLQKKSRT